MPEDELTTEEEAIEEPEQFIEEGDDLLIDIGGEDEAPESDPEEGQAEEDKATEAEEPTEFDIPETYQGKALPDIIKMHQEAQSKIGEMGTTVGELKKKLEQVNQTPEELRAALKAADVKALHDQEREKLNAMDPDEVPKEERYAQQKIVDQLSDEYLDKSQKEAISEIVNSGENKRFKLEQKEYLKETHDLSDDEIANVDTIAEQHYLENGKLTKRSYEHAMLDVYGSERIAKANAMNAEAKARDDISKATSKLQAGVQNAGQSKKGNYVNINKMLANPSLVDEYVATHTPEQVARLQEKLAKRM